MIKIIYQYNQIPSTTILIIILTIKVSMKIGTKIYVNKY
jgi:hypothetical protein